VNITIKYSQTAKGVVFNSRLIMGLAFYACSPPFSSLVFPFFLPSLHGVCMRWHISGYGSARKFYFLSLLVKQLGPWIECVFRGNHDVQRANKAL